MTRRVARTLGVAVTVPIVLGLINAPLRAQTASGQSIEGTWQGTLQVANGPSLRVEDKIIKTDSGQVKVMDYSIDQSGRGMTATSASFVDGAFQYSIVAIAGSYEGKMSADGKTITGTWTQGATSHALNLERVTADAAWPIPEPPKPMDTAANPEIEVATIKPSEPGRPGGAFTLRGRDVVTINLTAMALITEAYGVHVRQIVGGKPWMDTDKYDITIQPDIPGVPNLAQAQLLVQKLLADRFQLTFHHEKKELSAYVLVLGKGEPKLTKSEAGAPASPSLFFHRGSGEELPARNATMADFASAMGSVLDRPVVDQTGLKGRFDFVLKWTPDESQFSNFGGRVPPPSDSADAPPDLFTAIQEQLGLKLESTKAPVDVIVIDHVEKPSAN